MAKLLLHKDRLEIKLSASERALSRRSENISIERSAIRSATITEDPWIWVRGVRAPGTAIPLTVAIGRWKFHGGDDFLLLRGRKPAVVIDLDRGEFARVIVSTEHTASLIEALALDARPRRRRKAEPATEEVRMRQVAPRRVEATRASASDIAALAEYGLEPERHGLVSGLRAARANRAVETPGQEKPRGLRRLLPLGRHDEEPDQPVEVVDPASTEVAPDATPEVAAKPAAAKQSTAQKTATKPAAPKKAAAPKKPAATKPAATKKGTAQAPAAAKTAAAKAAATKSDAATTEAPAATKTAAAKAKAAPEPATKTAAAKAEPATKPAATKGAASKAEPATKSAAPKVEPAPKAKPATKSAATKAPASKSASKPASKPAPKSAPKSSSAAAESADEAAATGATEAKATGKPAGKPTGKPAEKPSGKPAGKPSGKTGSAS